MDTEICGFVEPGFEPVRQAFVENFAHRNELGAACCIYRHGHKVVDLWGGVRNKATGQPWEKDTIVLVYSATKGMSAMVMAIAHSRGWLDYDERVCAYWPEFARNGKDQITVRQLLAHQAGLYGFDAPVDKSVIADPARMAEVMADQKAAWGPGERVAYHAISLGFYEGEILRRVDPLHRTLGQFFQDEIATPLGEEFYIRLPDSMPDDRLAPLDTISPWRLLRSVPLSWLPDLVNRRSVFYRSLIANPGTLVARDEERIYARELEAPSGGGVGTARAMAHAYGVFAAGGAELGLRPETLAELEAPARPSRHGFYDVCMHCEMRYALGFTKSNSSWTFGSPRAYGAPGAGGALGFADPQTGIGYGYVTNRMGTFDGDPREVALRRAMERCL